MAAGIEIVVAHAFSSRCAPAGTARQTQAVLYYLQPYPSLPSLPSLPLLPSSPSNAYLTHLCAESRENRDFLPTFSADRPFFFLPIEINFSPRFTHASSDNPSRVYSSVRFSPPFHRNSSTVAIIRRPVRLSFFNCSSF